MSDSKKTRVLFVCLGNICRSPTAEAVMRHLVKQSGLTDLIEMDSAGIGGWHAGNPPDARSAAVGAKRGIPVAGKARQVTTKDFAAFDLLIAMDKSNREDLWALAPTLDARLQVHLLRDFDPKGPRHADVPDPYYGGPEGFEQVFDICLSACAGVLEHLRASNLSKEATA
jgi:protein-tyrosine phosphatase